jgi:hypothetical protein
MQVIEAQSAMVLEPHDHLHNKQIRAPQGTSRETVVCQIDLICAPQLMSAEGLLRAPNECLFVSSLKKRAGVKWGMTWCFACGCFSRAWGSCLAGSAFPDGCRFARAGGRVKDRAEGLAGVAGARRASLTRTAVSR